MNIPYRINRKDSLDIQTGRFGFRQLTGTQETNKSKSRIEPGNHICKGWDAGQSSPSPQHIEDKSFLLCHYYSSLP